MRTGLARRYTLLAAVFVAGFGWSSNVFADDHVKGVITGHSSNGSIVVQTDDASLTVTLSDSTKVSRTDGIREASASSATLIPGLRVRLDGEFEPGNHFAAKRVSFSRSDLKMAQAIAGGISTTDQRSVVNQQKIAENARLIQQQQETLARQAQEIATNRTLITENRQKIVATSGAVESANARIANLDDYAALKSVTIYFNNGSSAIASKYKTQLQQLAGEAKDVNAFMIQIQGYASAVGSEGVNQKLSKNRADNVAAVLQQSGVPLTSIVVPATMGTTDQVASNKTREGQAQNRRTVVTLLQNKGLAGK